MAITSDSRCATLAAASFPSTAITVPIGSMSTSPHPRTTKGWYRRPLPIVPHRLPAGPGRSARLARADRPSGEDRQDLEDDRSLRPLVQKHNLEPGGNHEARSILFA